MLIRLALLFLAIFSVETFGEGRLGYSMRTFESFFRIDVVESNGAREAVWTQPGGRYYMRSYKDGEYLHLPINNDTDRLAYTVYENGNIFYRGWLWSTRLSTIDVRRKAQNNTLNIEGKIADQTPFEFYTDVNKKGVKSFSLYFDEILVHVTSTSNKSAGSCNGRVYFQNSEVARVNCTSYGSLTDAFFWSEEDIIAWLIHVLIVPENVAHLKKQADLLSRLTPISRLE